MTPEATSHRPRGVVPIPPHEKLVNKPIEAARLNGHRVFDQKLVNMFFVIFLFWWDGLKSEKHSWKF
jgi:hypothetical protein